MCLIRTLPNVYNGIESALLDLNTAEEDISILDKLLDGVLQFSTVERETLKRLDEKFDIPQVEAVLTPSYFALYRVTNNACIVPKSIVHLYKCEDIAKFCDLKTLQWARNIGCQWGSMVCVKAVEGGRIDVVRWLVSNGCYSDNAGYTAARSGNLEMLKCLKEEGCKLNEWTIAYAAEKGYLNVVQWLRTIGCPWDKNTITLAALYGHVDVLQWCISEGCPYDDEAYQYALSNDQIEAAALLYKQS